MADNNEGAASDGEQTAQGGGPASVTIAYIAEAAGVSVPTVSKVLNGRSGVSDETRARVEELINKYGYRKPPGNRQKIVELVFRELESMWAGEILRGVEEVASRNRTGVLVSNFGLHDSEAAVGETVGRRPQCVLSVSELTETERDRLAANSIPYVVFDPIDDVPDGVPYVGATNSKGVQSAARHPIDLGHRRIAMISGPDHAFCLARVAAAATELALKLGRGEQVPQPGLEIATRLVVRESTAPPPQD